MKVSDRQLAKIFPTLSAGRRANYRPFLLAAMQEHRIDTRKRAVAFLAQLGHESSDLAHLKEIWGPTPAQRRYDIRIDLGNTPERDGDGELYKGRGGLQRTGRTNYKRAEQALRLPLLTQPELLEKPENAFRSDGLFWSDNNLNSIADRLTLTGDAKDLATFDKLTRRINGGYNGRVDRQRRYLLAIDSISEADFDSPTGPLPGETIPPATSALDTLNNKTASPAPELTADNSLAKLSANPTAKSAAVRVGTRIGRPIAALYATLEAGNLYAWLGVAVLVIGIGIVAYYERKEIARLARLAWSKVKPLL